MFQARIINTTLSLSTRRSLLPSISSTQSIVRWYRGDSGEMVPRGEITQDEVVERENKLFHIASPKYDKIQERHTRMPTLDGIPEASLPFDMVNSESSREELELEVRRKRLVYRAKQRGWLEVDLLLGTWANQNVHSLNADELDQFEAFVNLESTDIYNIITLRSDVPEDMKREGGNGVVELIQEWARSSPLGKAEPEKYSSVKKENNLI
jgi:succinate dehydrogenase assembly factor 2